MSVDSSSSLPFSIAYEPGTGDNIHFTIRESSDYVNGEVHEFTIEVRQAHSTYYQVAGHMIEISREGQDMIINVKNEDHEIISSSRATNIFLPDPPAPPAQPQFHSFFSPTRIEDVQVYQHAMNFGYITPDEVRELLGTPTNTDIITTGGSGGSGGTGGGGGGYAFFTDYVLGTNAGRQTYEEEDECTVCTSGEPKEPEISESDLVDQIVKIYPDMQCQGCGEKIHYPENIVEKLGKNETIKYMNYCKEAEVSPTLYCCGCFATLKQNPAIWNKYRDALNMYKRFHLHEKRLEKDLEVIEEQKKELTKQLLEQSDFKMKLVQDFNGYKMKLQEEKLDAQAILREADNGIKIMKDKYEEHIAKLEKELTQTKIKNMLFDINPLARLLSEELKNAD